MDNIKPTMRIVSQSKVKVTPGAVEGQTVRPLVGSAEFPSERIRVGLATFDAEVHEHLHWHPIEVFYYVLSGTAIVRDLDGKETLVGAPSRSTIRSIVWPRHQLRELFLMVQEQQASPQQP